MALRIGGWVILALFVILVVIVALAWTPDRSVDSLKQRWAAPPSKFIKLDGMSVHVRDEGPRADPLPVILLHGTGSSLYSWQAWTDILKKTHRIVRFDRPGFALTGPNPSGDYSMQYYADFLARLMDKLNIKRAIIVGNSSGGEMAWKFAAIHSDRVAGLILAAPTGYPRTTPLPQGLQMAMNPWAQPLVRHILPRSEVKKGLQGMFGDPAKVTPEMVDRSYELTLREGNRSVLGETLRQGLRTDHVSQIATIKVPTLILWGGKDNVIPMVPNAEHFHHDITGSKLVTFPQLGHMVQEEDPVGTLVPAETFIKSLQSPADVQHDGSGASR
jgi:pimeloyl-ACP methyl ester carboxylesterase